MQGLVTRLLADKGFGFIKDDQGEEYFFHRSVVGDLGGRPGFGQLVVGRAVTFEPEASSKGPRAGNVRIW